MRGKEIIFALLSTLAGVGLALGGYLAFGDRLSLVVYYALVLIGLGAGLVAVRIGRLGPFDGELGSPRLEIELRERVLREVERAIRYDRDFSILAVRQIDDNDGWSTNLRGSDGVISCRRGLMIMLLPETSRGGALMLLRRAAKESPNVIQAALVSRPFDGQTGDELLESLLSLVRASAQPGRIVMRGPDVIESLPIAV